MAGGTDGYYRKLLRNFRELPSCASTAWSSPVTVMAAVNALDGGNFTSAAGLADFMLRDDRVAGVLETRVGALMALPIKFKPQGDARRASPVAKEAAAAWCEMAPEAEVADMLRWGLLLGVSIGQIPWTTGNAGPKGEPRWTPRLRTWHPSAQEYRWQTDSYWVYPASPDGSKAWASASTAVEVVPGNGEWVVYAPHGMRRGFSRGLLRSLAVPWLVRQWALRDWARYSEVHGQPTKVGIVPLGTPAEKKADFLAELLGLGTEAALALERDGEAGVGYGYKLVEAASQSWEGFLRLMERMDENIAVAILGANLGVSIKSGGSYAAASVHADVGAGRTLFDAKTFRSVHPQILRPWAAHNFGDAGLAPLAKHSTKGLEDKKLAADTMLTAGTALKAWKDAGANVDVKAAARRFGLKLLPGDPPAPVPPKPPGVPTP